MNRRHLFFLVGLATCIWIASLQPSSPAIPLTLQWTRQNIVALDPVDADLPHTDLVAIYLRQSQADLQIRLDLLDHGAAPEYDLLVAIDSAPGGTSWLPLDGEADFAWEHLLVIPADGNLKYLDANGKPVRSAGFVVVRSPVLDQLMISAGLPDDFGRPPRVQVFIAPGGSRRIADRSAPAAKTAANIRPARVLAAFTNTFPAYTPATAVRRWNGAHTGPLGGSHGLAHLLSAASEFQAPMYLADLLRPESLSALDLVGALPMIRQMAGARLLILPRLHPGPSTRLNRMQDEIQSRFDLQSAAAAVLDDAVLSDKDPFEAAADGPSLPVRRVLVEAALAANRPGSDALILLGGELPNSTWGAPLPARATLRYLTSRPWIEFVDPTHAGVLITQDRYPAAPDAGGAPAIQAAPPSETRDLLAALEAAPANRLTNAAWQAYAAWDAPVFPHSPRLPELRRSYAGLTYTLLAAAAWAESPSDLRSCNVDADRDGAPECVLTNHRVYAVFDPTGGGLTHLFSRGPDGAHQWIAPSAQMISGLSDPAGWDYTRGLSADPSVIPGAFYELGISPASGARRAFTDAGLGWEYALGGGTVRRTFLLSECGMKVETDYGGSAASAAIPVGIAPDPWLRFSPGWAAGYRLAHDGNRVSVGLPGESFDRLFITSNTPVAVDAFSDTLQIVTRAENPDRDLPPGHFLPFPMFYIEAPPSGDSQVMIEIEINCAPDG